MKKHLLAILLCFATPVLAADAPRKIDFTTVLLDQDDKPMTECVKADPTDRTKCAEEKPLTLGSVAMQALNVPEQNLSYTDAVKRGQLSIMVYHSPGASLTSEEVSLIKAQLPKRFGPLVVTRAGELLDPMAK